MITYDRGEFRTTAGFKAVVTSNNVPGSCPLLGYVLVDGKARVAQWDVCGNGPMGQDGGFDLHAIWTEPVRVQRVVWLENRPAPEDEAGTLLRFLIGEGEWSKTQKGRFRHRCVISVECE